MSLPTPSTAIDADAPPALQSKRKLIWIEVARGIAATLVVFHHASQHLNQELGHAPFYGALDPGNAAVDFFFVLSGFLIMHVCRREFGKPRRIGAYLRKRVLRIYPIYWVALATFYVLHSFSANPSASLMPSSLLYEATLWPRPPETSMIVGVAWSLSYEMFFYVLFAAFLLHRQLGRAVFAGWALLALLYMVGVVPEPSSSALHLLTSEYSLLFPFGMGIAVLVERATHPKATTILSIALPALALLWFLQCKGDLPRNGPLPRMLYGLVSAITLYGLVLLDYEGKTTKRRVLLLLGECSYSIYLFHLVGIGVAAKVVSILGLYGKAPLVLIVATIIAAGVAAGLIGGVFVERPLVRWARRIV